MLIDVDTESPRGPGAKLHKLAEAIERLCHRGAVRPLTKILGKAHPADLAALLGTMPENYVAQVFEAIPDKHAAAEVLVQVNNRVQRVILSETPEPQLIKVLEELPPDELTGLIREIDPELAGCLMSALENSSKLEVVELLKFAPDTAGGIMTTDFFALAEDTSVEEAILAVRSHEDVEMIFYLYVTGSEGRLLGVISLRQLLLSGPEQRLREVMNRRIITVSTDTPQEEVAQLVDKYRLLAIPVTDQGGRLVGMITVDDVIEVLETETTQDMLRMAGTDKSEILTQSVFRIAGIRLPWLLAAFFGGLAATGVIRYFEGALVQVIALGAFLPVIMGMAGNVGVQSATVTVRGLATGTLEFRDLSRALYKELRVGLLLGIFYGIILAAYGWIVFDSTNLAKVVGLTILTNMTGAAVLAIFLPMLFHRIGVDPAIATGPFVTTAIDVFGVLNYFVIATIIMDLPIPWGWG